MGTQTMTTKERQVLEEFGGPRQSKQLKMKEHERMMKDLLDLRKRPHGHSGHRSKEKSSRSEGYVSPLHPMEGLALNSRNRITHLAFEEYASNNESSGDTHDLLQTYYSPEERKHEQHVRLPATCRSLEDQGSRDGSEDNLDIRFTHEPTCLINAMA